MNAVCIALTLNIVALTKQRRGKPRQLESVTSIRIEFQLSWRRQRKVTSLILTRRSMYLSQLFFSKHDSIHVSCFRVGLSLLLCIDYYYVGLHFFFLNCFVGRRLLWVSMFTVKGKRHVLWIDFRAVCTQVSRACGLDGWTVRLRHKEAHQVEFGEGHLHLCEECPSSYRCVRCWSIDIRWWKVS